MNKIETYGLSDRKKICMILSVVFILVLAVLISLRIGSIEISFVELIDGNGSSGFCIGW